MDSAPQYQRAVTPTIDNSSIGTGVIRGKVLNYQGPKKISKAGETPILPSALPTSRAQQISYQGRNVGGKTTEVNIQGRSVAGGAGRPTGMSAQAPARGLSEPSADPGAMGNVQRMDLIPLQDELPADGIIFARVRNQVDSLVVYRTPEERQRNPERLNLDRRQLDVCPILEMEQRLRLLNFQNNNIRCIQNLANLPNLIFLDLYNNKLMSLEGPVSVVVGLRVLMAGKNRIKAISNLSTLRKLDVLDLHSNEITVIEGLDTLSDLRVLNLAGMGSV